MQIRLDETADRLDVALCKQFGTLSRSYIGKAIRNGWVQQAGKSLKPSDHVEVGSRLEILGGLEESLKPSSERLVRPKANFPKNLVPRILLEDKAVLVLYKPAGLVIHAAPAHVGVTLVDWLQATLPEALLRPFLNPSRLGIVHRLDKDTTGVMVVAKTVAAQTSLSQQFRQRTVEKTYNAWIEGAPASGQGVVVAPVGRSRSNPMRMSVSGSGRLAETDYVLEENLKDVSRVSLHPKTGRTHQLRVHCAALGHPIVGDVLYGSSTRWKDEFGIDRPLLHARTLSFDHPVSQKRTTVQAEWPADFKEAGKKFKKAFALVALMSLGGWSLQAAETAVGSPSTTTSTAKPKKTTTAKSTSTEGSTSRVSKEVKSLGESVKQISADLAAVKESLANVQASLNQMDGSRRLSDLEKAISELNGRAVATQSVAEEAKTQALDATRKAKGLQDALDQFRDQVDRLQRELIQVKAQVSAKPAADDVPETTPTPATPTRRR